MSLAFVVCPVRVHDRDTCLDFYQQSETVRTLCEEVRTWTGIDVPQVLTSGTDAELGVAQPVCQGVFVLAMADLLARDGIFPRAVSGLSLGGLIAACMAGGVNRADLFSMLAVLQLADFPRPRVAGGSLEYPGGSEPEGSVAVCVIPYHLDPAAYCRELGIPGLFLMTDSGPTNATRMSRRISLVGSRETIDEFVASRPPEVRISVVLDVGKPPHSPLREGFVTETIDPLLAKMTFRAPRIPVVSCLDDKPLTTAADIRRLFRDNNLRPASVPFMTSGLDRQGVQAYLIVGPAMTSGFTGWTVPAVHVAQPQHVPEAQRLLHELNIESGQPAGDGTTREASHA
jgi:[acyl-carrier-protein] S-malonyltransferase